MLPREKLAMALLESQRTDCTEGYVMASAMAVSSAYMVDGVFIENCACLSSLVPRCEEGSSQLLGQKDVGHTAGFVVTEPFFHIYSCC